jgi:hypothetical protein
LEVLVTTRLERAIEDRSIMSSPSFCIPREFAQLRGVREIRTFDPESLCYRVKEVGVCKVNAILDDSKITALRSAFPENVQVVRNLLDRRIIRDLACSGPVRELASTILGNNCFAVGGTFFDRVPQANWRSFHQDLTIEVKEVKDAPGFIGWTKECGIQQVEPPTEILERMVSIRLYLDPSTKDNGPLKVFLGSHRHRRLSAEQIEQITRRELSVECLVPASAALVMKPLTLRGSSISLIPSRRRVIRLDFAAEDLPYGLEWRQRVGTA